ncbi:hypothetical protein ABH930_001693 [Kitasatospora sp. GAS204A]|nr:hypothetical protein [Kitasatospora sp. GAS204B]
MTGESTAPGSAPADRRMSFNAAASTYQRGRPPYPAAVFDLLAGRCGLRPGTRVLEIGAGTGLATGPLLAAGAHVVAVEPGENLAAILVATPRSDRPRDPADRTESASGAWWLTGTQTSPNAPPATLWAKAAQADDLPHEAPRLREPLRTHRRPAGVRRSRSSASMPAHPPRSRRRLPGAHRIPAARRFHRGPGGVHRGLLAGPLGAWHVRAVCLRLAPQRSRGRRTPTWICAEVTWVAAPGWSRRPGVGP